MSWADKLRRELANRARAWGETQRLPYYASLGSTPAILFEPASDGGTHGNFHPRSWARIRGRDEWAQRLSKPHQGRKVLPPGKRDQACELDSSNSSDALLMNCFCFPGASAEMLGLVGPPPSDLVFGYRAGVELRSGLADATEVDMHFQGILVEAKLTEPGFTRRPQVVVERYSRLWDTFEVDALPRQAGDILHYQLVRNVLATAQRGAAFVLLIDKRRPDLQEAWESIRACIRSDSLRARCSSRSWQQLSESAPNELRDFLAAKYGIA